jgi:ABC-type taurine transport system substrate-binding protein
MNVTCGEEPFECGEYIDWKPLFDKEDNLAGVASEDFIQKMLQHPKVIEAFGNEVSDRFVSYCTPEFYEKFVKRINKLRRIEQIEKERIVKAKPTYTALLGRWGK